MKLQNRLFLSVAIMGAVALAIGYFCLQSAQGVFDNQAKVYNSGLAVYHLKKVSDAYGVDVTGAVQKVRSGATWAWENGGKIIDEAQRSAEDHWRAYLAMDKSKDEKYQATIVGALLDNNKHLMENLKNDFANKDARDLEIQATSVLYPSIDPILDNIRKLEDLNQKIGEVAVSQADKSFTSSSKFMLGIVAGLLIFGFAVGFLAANWAIRPLSVLTRDWDGGVDQVSNLSSQVFSTSNQLSGNLTNTADELQKTGGSMEQVLSLVQQNNREIAHARNVMDDTRSALSLSHDAAQKTVDQVRTIGEGADRVFQVVKTIEEIAFQTNILALNAGVEAVRAGEQGKEFILVVEEIRNLSQRCSQVAKETSKLVTENTRLTTEGLRLSEETGRAVSQAAEKAGKVTALLSVMEQGLEAQFHDLREIKTTVQNSEREAYQNSALAEKAGTAGLSLSQQSENLRRSSKQLYRFINGGRKESSKAVSVPVAPGKIPVVQSTAPLQPSENRTSEKTGTDDAKVVRMNK